jgi:hypothetical protein
MTGSLVLGVAASKRCAIVARPNLYLRAPSSITASSTAYGSTTPHRNYSTVDRRPSERPRFLMVHPCAHVSSLAYLRAVNVNRKVNCSRLAPSVARQPVYSAIATALVYIIVVSGEIARPALALFVPLHSTCGICLLPFHISPNSYSSLPRMSQIEQRVQTSHAALEESPPNRFESVYLSATYQAHGLKS